MENYIKNLIRNIWTKLTSTRNQVHRYQTNKHLLKTQGSHKTAEMLQALSLFLQQHYQFRFNLLTEGTEFKLKFRIWNSSRLSILSKCSQSLVILNNLDG